MKRSPTSPSVSAAQVEAAAADWVIRRDLGLADIERAGFEKWVAADPRHSEAIARHEQAWSLLDRPRHGGRTSELLRALPGRIARRRRRRVGAGLTAVALAMVAVTTLWQGQRDSVFTSGLGHAQVLMPRKAKLPDGSEVELKGDAKIFLDYSAAARRITLDGGEALFHVAKDANRPFVVRAAGVMVEAIGTVFLVPVGGAHVDVIVTEGKVAVERASAPRPRGLADSPESSEGVTLVHAGTHLTVDPKLGLVPLVPAAISATEIAARLEWRSPFLEFTDVPLHEAVAILNRHSPVRLVVDDPALAAQLVNGRFRADNSETLSRLLESSFGVEAQRHGDKIVLRKAKAGARQK